MNTISLALYVIGPSEFCRQAIQHVNALMDRHPECDIQLDVVDVLEQPELAEEHKILATPTLLRTHPMPVCRIIGDLSDSETVARILGLSQRHGPWQNNVVSINSAPHGSDG